MQKLPRKMQRRIAKRKEQSFDYVEPKDRGAARAFIQKEVRALKREVERRK